MLGSACLSNLGDSQNAGWCVDGWLGHLVDLKRPSSVWVNTPELKRALVG